jgi:hypothetical protein
MGAWRAAARKERGSGAGHNNKERVTRGTTQWGQRQRLDCGGDGSSGGMQREHRSERELMGGASGGVRHWNVGPQRGRDDKWARH